MNTPRHLGPLAAFALLAACNTSNPFPSAPDASSRDVPTPDVPASDVPTPDVPASDVPAPDVPTPDVPSLDAPSLDVPSADVHTCPPVVVDDVPAADVPASDRPYVVELSIEGNNHQCARMSDGTLHCRGTNGFGELGLGTRNAVGEGAVAVPGVTDVAQVITDESGVTCARHVDGSVRCWGNNATGMVGVGHDGDVAECRCRPSPTLVPGLTDVTQLAADTHHVYAVRRDGSVWSWGETGGGSATPAPVASLSDVAQLWSTYLGVLVHLRSGAYVLPGTTSLAIPPEAVIDEANPSLVDHICYRLPDGSVRCLGNNASGALGDGTMTSSTLTAPVDPGLCGVRSVALHVFFSCALMGDRTVQLWGGGQTRPAAVAGVDGVERVFLGNTGACALRVDHSVLCWRNWGYGFVKAPTPVAW